MSNLFKKFLEKLRVGEIARRYAVINGFDGILTVLGITVGAFTARVSNPSALISSGLGTAIGLLVSGVSGAYVTEKAERLGDFKELKKTMLDSMENSVQKKKVTSQSVFIAGVNGASPFLCAVASVIPYFLAKAGIIPMLNTAYYLSIGISVTLLAVFGSFLGKISKESMAVYAFKMVAVGGITVLLSYLLGLAGL